MSESAQNKEISVQAEKTSDAQSMKFVFDVALSQRQVEYKNVQEAAASSIAKKVFGFPWTERITVGANFVVVTKQDWVDWEVLEEPLKGLLKEHVEWAVKQAHDKGVEYEENLIFAEPKLDSPQAEKVQRLIDTEINPSVAAHGGHVTLVDYKDDQVFLRFGGGCQGCGMSAVTLKEGIEVAIKNAMPEVKAIIDVTNHAAGANPYY